MKGEIRKSYSYYKIIKDVDVVDELKKRNIKGKITGENLLICCPVHGEKNPSFGINIKSKKGICNCMSCGWTGNFFHLLSFLDEISFEKVISKYSKKHIGIEEIKELKNLFLNNLKEKKENKNEIKYFNSKFLDKFKKPYGDFLEYLILERKLTKETIKKFNILCCDGSGKGYGKVWKNRIVIPIFDLNNKFAGCTARYILKCEKENKVRKIPGSDISKICYGLENIKKRSPVVVVEGEIDMIYLQQNWVPAVRTGKFISKQMINKLLDYGTEDVVLGLDGDVSYFPDLKRPKDCIQYQKEYLSKFFKVNVVVLPKNKDPNDLSKKEIQKYFGKYQNKNYFK